MTAPVPESDGFSRRFVLALAVIVFVAAFLQLSRPGYSVDEEFTVFAVRGIQADGLPLLPSGLLYDRGIAYSYASWAAGLVLGWELPWYRGLSLLFAIASIVLVFAIVRRVATDRAALVATVLVAASLPFWATATTARFYAPFFALYLACVLLMQPKESRSVMESGDFSPRLAVSIIIAAVLCRWLHELAFTLPAIPLACAILGSRSERARWLKVSAAVGAGLALAQAGLLVLHYLAPSSGDTMVRRFFVWQVVNLFERPGDRQFGMVLVLMVIAWLIAPRRAGVLSAIALSGVAMIVAFSVARATNEAPLTRELVSAILREGSRYPLDMFWHISRTMPMAMALAISGLAARLAGAGGEWRATERAVHLAWIGWVLWFGVIESGITINYLLVPVSLMLVAIAVDLDAIVRHNISAAVAAGRLAGLTVILLIALGVASEQWRGEGSLAARLEAARPTIAADGIDDIRAGLLPADRIACTDELGCLMLLGRIDAWLALDDYVRERFLVRIGDNRQVGVYTGAPAVFRPADLFAPGLDGKLPDRTIVVDVFKEYPIGNSRVWLPRAIEEDGLEVRPILETSQLRVLQISPQQRQASRQP